MEKEYVEVHVLDVPYGIDHTYLYFLPPFLRDGVVPGTLLTVPFGKSNKKTKAVVVEGKTTEECGEDFDPGAVKSALAIENEGLTLSDEMLRLAFFMKEYYLCTVGEAVRCMLPPSVLSSVEEYYAVNEEKPLPPESIGEGVGVMYAFIRKQGSVALRNLRAKYGADEVARLAPLVRKGYLLSSTKIVETDKKSYTTRVYLNLPPKEIAKILMEGMRSEGQTAILRALLSEDGRVDRELCEATGGTAVNLHALEKKGYIRLEKEDDLRDPYKEEKTGDVCENVVLNEEQGAACEKITSLYETHEAKCVLLHGVTGSGKTSVIKKAIDRVLADGRTVIVLVPEIALTPQTVNAFCGYYKEKVAVIHSALSAGERYDAYRQIRSGAIRVVIGTRSAVFAPLPDIGMIVIDEEQETTYKSDASPRYLTHDIAKWRVNEHHALLLLSSATPSLTSYHKAKTGAYTLVTMKNRYGNATLPDVVVEDMREEMRAGNTSLYSRKLVRKIGENLENGKQSVLFLNRRGYHTYLTCKSCGQVVECPNCSISLTYHTYRRIDENEITAEHDARPDSGYLICHCCGYRAKVPLTCPHCGDGHLSYMGAGTQRAENELTAVYPEANILRMDADTTTTKASYDRILGNFRDRKSDILLGTQMVTKGHDFPAVTLVGVLMADASLYVDDYRAGERTFSLLTQVIGRAGRGKDPGVALIQTSHPDDETITLAAKQDYEAFYEKEIILRKNYQFPPFCDIVLFTLSAADEVTLGSAGTILRKTVYDLHTGTYTDVPLIVFGPFEAPVYRAQNRYRLRMVLKCRLNKRSRAFLRDVLTTVLKESPRSQIAVDLNPSNL